ncbi:type IV pilus modification protein PilV [Aliikangiella coralliicola]|uniref:Type IV pilus modification protein PilV n=1 Tax=Aliikangiella coralliicola TaxID=2592383 RepID=A0A545UAC9_9GAMM|nr:type IV pilus modification protein PilV [Aliikangiella coralliicola]TQV86399.1 type IV pilus modification protein PilV [Aliikangiella coralliicola]
MLVNNQLSAKKQSGISLIEILVTTLILGIGLLGVAALQVSSVSSNQEGYFASQATSIAEDYASRIRASKTAVMMANPNITYANFLALYHNGNNAALACDADPETMCRGANDCTPAQLAIFDMWEVCSAAAEDSVLPDGQVRVINNGIRLTIVVDWDSAEGRQDTGNVTVVNANCQALTGSDDRNCMIMELVP